jgi:hypothetical protein
MQQSSIDSEIESLISEIATLEFKVTTFKMIRSIASRFEQEYKTRIDQKGESYEALSELMNQKFQQEVAKINI